MVVMIQNVLFFRYMLLQLLPCLDEFVLYTLEILVIFDSRSPKSCLERMSRWKLLDRSGIIETCY